MNDQPLSESEMVAWRAFMEMQEVLRGAIDRQLQTDSGMSSTDYTVLVALSEEPGGQLRALNLAQRLQWEKSRLHHHLTRMCRRGLVERLSGEGRTSVGAITPKGLAALEAALPSHRREVRRLVFDRLSEEQVQQLAEISLAILHGDDRRSTAGSTARRG